MNRLVCIFVAMLALSAASHSRAQGLVNTRFGDPAFFAEEEAKKQEEMNALQDKIDNIEADPDPNRTAADEKKANELQTQLFDRQGDFRTLNQRMAEQKLADTREIDPPCGPQGNGNYILCETVPGINPIQNDPAAFLRQLYILALALAGTVAFVQIVRGGILYSLSGVVNSKNEAKAIFKGVAQGLALLMGAYVVLNTINPALVNLKFPDAENYFPTVVGSGPFGNGKTLEEIDDEIVKEMQSMKPLTQDQKLRVEEYQKKFDNQAGIDTMQDEVDIIKTKSESSDEDTKRAAELEKQIMIQKVKNKIRRQPVILNEPERRPASP